MVNVAPKEIYYYNVTVQANVQVPFLSKFGVASVDPRLVRNPKINFIGKYLKMKFIELTFFPILFFGGKSNIATAESNFFKSKCKA